MVHYGIFVWCFVGFAKVLLYMISHRSHKICTLFVLLYFADVIVTYTCSSQWIRVIHLPISFRITSLALGQLYNCPSASEVIRKDMGENDLYHTKNKTQQCTNHLLNSWDVLYMCGIWFIICWNIASKTQEITLYEAYTTYLGWSVWYLSVEIFLLRAIISMWPTYLFCILYDADYPARMFWLILQGHCMQSVGMLLYCGGLWLFPYCRMFLNHRICSHHFRLSEKCL